MRRSKVSFVALFLFASSALAGPVDFGKPLIDIKGKPMHETDDKNSPTATLGTVAAVALLRQDPPDPRGGAPDPVRLAKRALLAQRVGAGKVVDLTAEETAEIKKAIAVFSPLIVLRVIEAVDPAALK